MDVRQQNDSLLSNLLLGSWSVSLSRSLLSLLKLGAALLLLSWHCPFVLTVVTLLLELYTQFTCYQDKHCLVVLYPNSSELSKDVDCINPALKKIYNS